jgi:6-phosphogluconolactonase
MRRDWFSVWSAVAAILVLLGVPLKAQFAYVGNPIYNFARNVYDSGNIYGYTINPSTGALTPIAGSPFAAGSAPWSMAVDPSGRFAYVPNSSGNNVSGYTIDPTTGALTPIVGSPFAAGLGAISVAVDPTGQFVYVANGSSDNVSGYSIDRKTGALTPVQGSPSQRGWIPIQWR